MKVYVYVACLVLLSNTVFAQQFGVDAPVLQKSSSSKLTLEQNIPSKTAPRHNKKNNIALKNGLIVKPVSLEAKSKKDGIRRGAAEVSRVYRKGETMSAADSAAILLYYDNFNVFRSVSGRVTCNVRIHILSSLTNNLKNFSAKLVWPGLTTRVMFDDVMPNRVTYVDYALLGEGCYSMDKIPNIVLSRCRVKGLSASVCASKVKWVKRVK